MHLILLSLNSADKTEDGLVARQIQFLKDHVLMPAESYNTRAFSILDHPDFTCIAKDVDFSLVNSDTYFEESFVGMLIGLVCGNVCQLTRPTLKLVAKINVS